MTDVAAARDASDSKLYDKRDIQDLGIQDLGAIRFFQSLAFILPCCNCRESYSRYIFDDPPDKSLGDLLGWVYRIKEKVNDKLMRPQESRPSIDMFKRRVATSTRLSSPSDIWDFLSILGLNYDPERLGLKRKYMKVLHDSLPLVLPHTETVRRLSTHRPSDQDLLNSGSYLDWLYRLRRSQGPLPPPSELWKKYDNARAGIQEPLDCPYLVQ